MIADDMGMLGGRPRSIRSPPNLSRVSTSDLRVELSEFIKPVNSSIPIKVPVVLEEPE